MSYASSLLREVVSRSQIPTKKPHLAIHVLFQQHFSVGVFEFAMNRNGSCSGNCSHPPGTLAACLETANRAVQNDEVSSVLGSAVAIAIHMVTATLLLELANL